MVKLSNGVEAAVVDFNPRHPTRPKVQGIRNPYGERYLDPAQEEIDMALHPELRNYALQDVDITAYLSSQETFNVARQPTLA